MKYNKMVPEGRAPKELYQMICEGSGMLRRLIVSGLNAMWQGGAVLGTWQYAQTAKLDKHNGKEGTGGPRLINMLDPLGKMFFGRLEERGRDEWYDYAYGYYDHRRREQPLLVHYALTWRLREAAGAARPADKGHYSYVTPFRDITNASPSVAHESMNLAIDRTNGTREAAFLKFRHMDMQVRIDILSSGSTVVCPRVGGAQGDRVMPRGFPSDL